MKKLSVNKYFFFDILRATVIAVIVSLVTVLVFSLIVNLTNVNEKIILPVNEAIKVVSILIGCFIGFKELKHGAFKGAISGLLYTFLSILIFGIISHSVKFNALSLIDVALGIVAGAISGIIVVNLKRKSVTQ